MSIFSLFSMVLIQKSLRNHLEALFDAQLS
ncbi:MAG: hypothetical protein RL615_267 [Pseudomonadota bacterium]|jgi:hypothetical protein